MENVIVTGATSFIGAPLVKKLTENGYFVYAIIRPNSKNISMVPTNENVKIIECDLNDIYNLFNLIPVKCSTFFHIAWNGTRVPERDNQELQMQNYEKCIEAYEVAKKIGCSCFISTGSQAEYGKCTGIITEDYPTNPITEYGKAKLLSYNELKLKALKDGIKLGWIRIFSAYGPNDYKNSLISMCIDKMQRNEDIELTSGLQNWNYIFIEDVVNILFELMVCDNYKCETFNVCSNDSRQLRDYVLELKEIIKSNSKLLFGVKDYNESEGIVSFIPKNINVSKILNYKKYVSFRDGILDIIKKRGEML